MKKGKKLLSLMLSFVLVLALVAFGLTACGDDDGNKGSGGGLSQTRLTLEVGESYTLSTSGDAQWEIADANVAKITVLLANMCQIDALKEGTTTITAKVGSKTYTCTLTVTAPDVITIKKGATDVTGTTVNVVEKATMQLTASSTLGSKIKWSTSDDKIATVSSTGLVTGVKPGTVTITAKVNDDKYATVTVKVGVEEGSTYYKLKFGAENGEKAFVEADGDFTGEALVEDEYFMWNARAGWGQQNVVWVQEPEYRDGKISFSYTSDWEPGYWYGVQIMRKNSDQLVGRTYNLTCKINVKSASQTHDKGATKEDLKKIKVTLNDTVIELETGKVNDVSVPYVYTAPLHNAGVSSFDLTMGWQDSTSTGWFAQNASVEISDVAWTEVTPEKLAAPSFTYASGKITITDTNDAAKVGGYRAVFYKGADKVGSTMVTNGNAIDTSTLDQGTYTVKLQAVAANAKYLDSDVSSTSAEITVTTGASYDMTDRGGAGEAIATPGRWAFWAQSWVSITESKFSDGVASIAFTNNDGTFDSLQLLYKNPALTTGKTYKLTFDLELVGDDGGHITVNGSELAVTEGKHNYTVGYTEAEGVCSFVMIGAIPSQVGTGTHEIVNGTIKVSNLKWEEAVSEALSAPATVSAVKGETDNDYTLNFATVENAKSYEAAYFKTGETDPVYTIENVVSGEKLKWSAVITGEYRIKVRAVGDGVLFTTSAWSTQSAAVSIKNDAPEEDIPYGANGFTWKDGIDESNPDTWGPEGDVTLHNDKWYYWNDKNTNGSNVTVTQHATINGVVTATFSSTGTNEYGLQLFYDYSTNEADKEYTLVLTIEASYNGTVKINGKAVTLVANTPQQVTVDFTEPKVGAYKGASIVIQVNVSGGTAGTIKVSGVSMTEKAAA